MSVIAVPASFADHNIFGHFGKCEVFQLFTVEDGKVVSKVAAPTNGKGHSQLAGFLAAKGADTVLCSSMGQGAYEMLTQSSIRVIRGAAGDIDTAVARYLAGELSDNTAAVCSHHHGEHGASHSCNCSGGCHR